MKQSLRTQAALLLLGNKLDPQALERCFLEEKLRPSQALDFVFPANIKAAAVQLPLQPATTLRQLVEPLRQLVDQGCRQGAQLIAFPAYMGLWPLSLSPTLTEEVLALVDEAREGNFPQARQRLEGLQELSALLFTWYYNTFALLAHQSHLYIHAGSTLLYDQGRWVQRGFLFDPRGEVIQEQDQLFLSPVEKALGFSAGSGLDLCNSPFGPLVTLVGRDSFYFESAKVARQLGARILLCPLSPEEAPGEVAQRCGPWMRCQEQPLYALAPRLIGPWRDGTLSGQAAILGPYEASRVSPSGILAQGKEGQQQLLLSRLDLERLNLPLERYHSQGSEAFGQQLTQAYASLGKREEQKS